MGKGDVKRSLCNSNMVTLMFAFFPPNTGRYFEPWTFLNTQTKEKRPHDMSPVIFSSSFTSLQCAWGCSCSLISILCLKLGQKVGKWISGVHWTSYWIHKNSKGVGKCCFNTCWWCWPWNWYSFMELKVYTVSNSCMMCLWGTRHTKLPSKNYCRQRLTVASLHFAWVCQKVALEPTAKTTVVGYCME